MGQTYRMPWAMVISYGGPLARHPSQLYEAFLEGLVLFVILWLYPASPTCYGNYRVWRCFLRLFPVFFLFEFFRMPMRN